MKKPRKFTEAYLVDIVSTFLIQEGYYVRHEVPNMGQSADIVATKSGRVLAIEAKIGNWRRALNQCKAHEIVADYVCIALEKKPRSSELFELLSANGYGLISCSIDGEVEWCVKPKINRKIWRPQRKVFVEAMKGICYAC